MLKVYFTASTSHNGDLIPYYQKIFNYISGKNVSILSGLQVVNKNVLEKDKEITAVEIFNREKQLIDQTDIVIAEVSKPSLGVGAEIVYALNENKPVLAMVRTDYEDRISPMLSGNPSNNLYLEYYRDRDFPKIIDSFLENIGILVKHTQILKKTKGKLIVFEGGDGSGKTTQVNLLHDYLRNKHILTKIVDYPQYYKSFHGDTVARFLRGEFGTIDQISPYLAALAYALDRVSSKKEIIDSLKKGSYVLANRYVTSSLVHQGSKFDAPKKRAEFEEWIKRMEYDVHGMPREDLVIYLYMPWKIAIQLTKNNKNRLYLKGMKEDIHERDIEYRKKVEKMYLATAKKYKHWVKIDCVKNGKILTPRAIHRLVLSVLHTRINLEAAF